MFNKSQAITVSLLSLLPVKFISVTILFICLIAATFSQWLMIICFDINQTGIADALCVNKNNAAAHCNGHCYLNKQLDKSEKTSNPLSSSSKEKFEIQLFSVTNASPFLFIYDNLFTVHAATPTFAPQEFINLHFHPPSLQYCFS
ncbi:hypothetical protein BH11BAC6_BH11BAC6_13510 [soil metagenome]